MGTTLMTESRQLGNLKTGPCSLKEQLARRTLRNVRLHGHSYVELRKDGKREVFFCTLCLSPCYSDSVLYTHLKGSLHAQRLAAAKTTLLKPNPWPFSDGVLFFIDPPEIDKDPSAISNTAMMLSDAHFDEGNGLSIVSYDKDLGSYSNKHVPWDGFGSDNNLISVSGVTKSYELPRVLNLDGYTEDRVLVIPRVLSRDEVSNLEVTYMGLAQIAARFTENESMQIEFRRIWCEWLGREDSNIGDSLNLSEHDFAVVTFPYAFNLGRKDLLDEIKYLLPPNQLSESEDNNSCKNGKRKSFSDPGDVGESVSNNHYDSSGEECQSSNSACPKFLVDAYDDNQLQLRVLKSKSMRRELRKQQRLAAERMCDLCQQKMLPGKDVASLLNRKTGRLACSSRNPTGAFHVFHVSCLIHWILLCELEVYSAPPDEAQLKNKPRKKAGRKRNSKKVEQEATRKRICSVLCPECQGTGVMINGDELEKPTIPLSEMFRYKIKASDGHKAWMKSPEVLQNCSTGFYFPTDSEDGYPETTSKLKLLLFYRANV